MCGVVNVHDIDPPINNQLASTTGGCLMDKREIDMYRIEDAVDHTGFYGLPIPGMSLYVLSHKQDTLFCWLDVM